MNSRPLMERPSRDPALNVRAPLCLPGALDSKASVRIRFCREQSLLSEQGPIHAAHTSRHSPRMKYSWRIYSNSAPILRPTEESRR